MKIAAPNQYVATGNARETRAALDPAAVKKLVGMKLDVFVESGLGQGAYQSDDAYTEAGATVVPRDQAMQSIWSDADIVLTLGPPTVEQVNAMREGAVLIGTLAPLANHDVIKAAAAKKVIAFATEFIPRISRAQAMDVLSSQANIGGYIAVVRAASACTKMFPMMITAAGTIAPAKVFVIGAGVAGLQAIATAKRLGAAVEAFDVRPVVKEQVQSLGARFVELPIAKSDAETSGGYAKEQTDEDRRKQAELMAKHVTGADVVITTAAVFGKAPPMLIPADVVKNMKGGAVLVDMAANLDAGRGNCEATKPGEVYTTDNDVTIDGTLNLPCEAPVHATQMYANNMIALLKEIVDGEGALKLDFEDEIQKGAVMTRDGEVVNDLVKKALEGGG